MLLAKTFRSSTFRLALINIAAFGAAVVALLGYVYWSTASYGLDRTDRALAAERVDLQTVFANAGRDALIAAIDRRLAQNESGRVYLLADERLLPLAGNLRAWPPALEGEAGWGTFRGAAPIPGSAPASRLRATFTTLPDKSRLLVGTDIGDLDVFMRRIETAILLVVALIFVLAGTASLYVTRRTVGRIEAINATSRAIMQTGLDQRIPLRGTRDEWDELAANLNTMLDRIEALMGEVRQFTDNVAHDLRTPLTRMRSRLEKAQAAAQDDNPREKSLIGDILAELDGVIGMFTSLMRVSRIEASDQMAAFRRVDLATVAHEVAELFDAAAEAAGGHVEVLGDDHALITGDRDLLFDAVSNLVDNAIKHGRESGRVAVAVYESDRGTVISVADEGPGIPLEERDRVFKRFYRLERSRHSPGNGLGLSLVAAVARLHGAHIELLDRAPGIEIRLVFPTLTLAGAESRPAAQPASAA